MLFPSQFCRTRTSDKHRCNSTQHIQYTPLHTSTVLHTLYLIFKSMIFRVQLYLNRKRKLKIYTSPTKAKSREPAYLQALNQNKIYRQGSISRVRQGDNQTR